MCASPSLRHDYRNTKFEDGVQTALVKKSYEVNADNTYVSSIAQLNININGRLKAKRIAPFPNYASKGSDISDKKT